jgi:glucose-6-phosphate isomerase
MLIIVARKFSALVGVLALIAGSAFSADGIKGQVRGGGAPIVGPVRHHDRLISNVFAEAPAFSKTPKKVEAEGTPEWLVPHRVFEGNRLANTIFVERLTHEGLGKLLGLYDDSTFTQGAIWNIDSFGQWGVELGKSWRNGSSLNSRAKKNQSLLTTVPPTT